MAGIVAFFESIQASLTRKGLACSVVLVDRVQYWHGTSVAIDHVWRLLLYAAQRWLTVRGFVCAFSQASTHWVSFGIAQSSALHV